MMFWLKHLDKLITENKDFWKLLHRNFVVNFHYLLDFLFCFFVAEKNTILPNEEIIRHNTCNVELQLNICDV